jgi:hypothetical protein
LCSQFPKPSSKPPSRITQWKLVDGRRLAVDQDDLEGPLAKFLV